MAFFKNILVYYNEAFAGIREKVFLLAEQTQADLTVIDVFEKFDDYLEVMPPSVTLEELKSLAVIERRREIMDLFHDDPALAGRVTVMIEFGNAPVEIIKQVLRGGHDLVIKAATGNKTLSERLFGNVAVKLLRKCPCPVLIVKSSEDNSFHKILAPVDPEAAAAGGAGTGDPLSRKIMDIASFLTRMGNGHLDVLHCWHLPGETLFSSGRTRIDPSKLNYMKALAEKIHAQRIHDLVAGSEISDLSHSVHVLKGDAGKTIADIAKKNNTDLIVMGSVGRSGVFGLLVGSTAETVIDLADCSVLRVNTDDFESPVSL